MIVHATISVPMGGAVLRAKMFLRRIISTPAHQAGDVTMGLNRSDYLCCLPRCFCAYSFQEFHRFQCLGRALSDSNRSINYFDFSVFSVIWGLAFRSKLTPMARKTSHSGTLLAQGAHLRNTTLSKAGVLPKTFWHSWHSWHSSTRLETLSYLKQDSRLF